MTQATFTDSLLFELKLRGLDRARPAVGAFVASCWPLIEDNPDLGV